MEVEAVAKRHARPHASSQNLQRDCKVPEAGDEVPRPEVGEAEHTVADGIVRAEAYEAGEGVNRRPRSARPSVPTIVRHRPPRELL